MATKKTVIIEKDYETEIEEKIEETILDAKKLVQGERVSYTPSRAYSVLFPNGIMLFLNGVQINLLFDGRTYMFTPQVRDYVDKKLESIASRESKINEQYANPTWGKIAG